MENVYNGFLQSQKLIVSSKYKDGFSFGQLAFLYYKLEKYVLEGTRIDYFMECDKCYRDHLLKEISCYISPYCIIEDGVYFKGNNIVVEGFYKVCSGCVISDNVAIIDDNKNKCDKKYYVIGKNTYIKNGVRIKNCDIGKNVVVESNCMLRENVEDNCKVSIINQFQITQMQNTYIPSQRLIVYGVVPKYKNKFTIYGEGIYNPNILVRWGDKKVSICDIEYWDKSKIIVKLKCDKSLAQKLLKEEKEWRDGVCTKIVLMSRGVKNTINDNKVLIKLLKNI